MSTRYRRSTAADAGGLNPATVFLLTISKLKEELQNRGLAINGTKKELAIRLDEHIQIQLAGNSGYKPFDPSPTTGISTTAIGAGKGGRGRKRKYITLDEPMAKEKQPETANKQPLNVLEQDYAKLMENCNQLKKEMDRLKKQGTHNFIVTNELAEKMKEASKKTTAVTALMSDGVDIHPIRKRIQLILKNCRELFAKDEFSVRSTSLQLFGFKWHLEAKTKKKGFLGLYLNATPPNYFNGNYRIEIDRRFSIVNAFNEKDLIMEGIGRVYTFDDSGWGRPKIAKFEDLLDLKKGFLTPEGDIEIWADFTIKSSTLNHLT